MVKVTAADGAHTKNAILAQRGNGIQGKMN